MQQLIDNYEIPRSFSSADILKLVENQANLVTHPEIAKYHNINHLLGPYNACIILYITREGSQRGSLYGHWCCIFRNINNGILTYFDPYGRPIDAAVNFMTNQMVREFGRVPELTLLLQRSPPELIDVNKYDLQIHRKGISTCGRHTGMRLQFRQLNNAEYAALMSPTKKLVPDEVVTLMTSFIN